MDKSTKITTALLMIVLTFPALSYGQPDRRSGTSDRWLRLADQQLLNKKQAIEMVKRQHKGKVLSADLVQKNKKPVYKVKVLTDKGRVKTIRVKADKPYKKKN